MAFVFKRPLAEEDLLVSFEMVPAPELGDTYSGIYACLSTGTLCFYRDRKAVKLEDIDQRVFTEIMRDVDLFVSVASVGSDPNWELRHTQGYWHEYGFGTLNASAEIRKQVIAQILPKLKIANQSRIEGRYLHVQGKLREYKIHLGSGNIMMEPDNRYLCIVQGGKTVDVYLPFEGDARLSLILSKAFMLAQDHKIKDESILSQIKM